MASRSLHAAWDQAGIDVGVARHEAQSRALAFDPADEFYPGEPIGAPVRPRSRLRTSCYVLILAAVGWGLAQTTRYGAPG